MAYKLFKTEAEAQEQYDALNTKPAQGFRFIVEKQPSGQHWAIVNARLGPLLAICKSSRCSSGVNVNEKPRPEGTGAKFAMLTWVTHAALFRPNNIAPTKSAGQPGHKITG